MAMVDNFIANHTRILAEPHTFEVMRDAPRTQDAFTAKRTAIVVRYELKSTSFYDIAIGRPAGAYNGALVGKDGPYVTSMINGRPPLERGLFGIRLTGGTADLGVRYLPWGANQTTFLRLRDEARLFFTGPLQGCNIYVARSGGSVYVAHANWNKDPGDLANHEAKETGYELAKNFFDTMGVTDLGALRKDEYAPSGGPGGVNGFVYGVKSAGRWSFYAHVVTFDGTAWRVDKAAHRFARE